MTQGLLEYLGEVQARFFTQIIQIAGQSDIFPDSALVVGLAVVVKIDQGEGGALTRLTGGEHGGGGRDLPAQVLEGDAAQADGVGGHFNGL